jgi:hypothetical protein
MLIDVAISGDRNVRKKEAERILKYKDITVEIQDVWNVKTNMILLIIEANGTISKLFIKYLSKIRGKHEINELQKTVILGTAHILRKVLIQECNRFNTVNSVMCTMNSNYRVAATLYYLET